MFAHIVFVILCTIALCGGGWVLWLESHGTTPENTTQNSKEQNS